MKIIGSTFSDELRAAGLIGLPFSWGDDGTLSFSEEMTDGQIAAVQAVFDAHDPLGSEKEDAYRAIDAAAGAVRGRYITIAPGQEATYLLKAQQALAFKQAGYTGPIPGLVQAEVDATNVTAQQATDAILAQQSAWEAKAAEIESARRRWKVSAGNATTPDEIWASYESALAELATL